MAFDIARDQGLACTAPQIFATGTNLVVGLDGPFILKIFPPMHRAQFVSERGSLAELCGRLRVPIPEIVCEGEHNQWPYLVMTRLPGILGAEAWPALPEEGKLRVLAQLGETIAEVQHVPPGRLLDIEPRWDAFMRGQIEGCRATRTWPDPALPPPEKTCSACDLRWNCAAAANLGRTYPMVYP